MPASSPGWCRLTGTFTRTRPSVPWRSSSQRRRAPADDRQHRVVERGAVDPLGRVVQRVQRDEREGDLARGADAAVEGRAAARGGARGAGRRRAGRGGGRIGGWALRRWRRTRCGARLRLPRAGGPHGGVAAWASSTAASQSTSPAKRIEAAPSASAWWMRQIRALPPSASGRRRCARAGASDRAARRTGARPRRAAPARRVAPAVAATTWSAISKSAASTQAGASRLPPRRRVRAGALTIAPAIARAQRVEVRCARPARTTLQVCPATVSLSSARIARSSGSSGAASMR